MMVSMEALSGDEEGKEDGWPLDRALPQPWREG